MKYRIVYTAEGSLEVEAENEVEAREVFYGLENVVPEGFEIIQIDEEA